MVIKDINHNDNSSNVNLNHIQQNNIVVNNVNLNYEHSELLTHSFDEFKNDKMYDILQQKVPFFKRILSVIIDYLIFSPLFVFIVHLLFQDGINLYKSFPQSDEALVLFYYLIVLVFLSITTVQSVFLSLWQATPGQKFMKLKVHFVDKEYPLFLQAFFRQTGFLFSFFLLGIPFLHLIFQKNRMAFYEKMTQSFVIENKNWSTYLFLNKNVNTSKDNLKTQRMMGLTTLATLNIFCLLLFTTVIFQSYKNLLHSPLSYKKFKSQSKFNENNDFEENKCEVFSSFKTVERLQLSIAFNLAGLFSDKCLNKEADFVLWKDFTDHKSLAYFAKFLTSAEIEKEKKYLDQACNENQNAEGCLWSIVFRKKNFDQINQQKELQTIIGYIVNNTLKNNYNFQDNVSQYQSLSLFKKYKLQNQLLTFLETEKSSRNPASVSNFDHSKNDEQSVENEIRNKLANYNQMKQNELSQEQVDSQDKEKLIRKMVNDIGEL